MKKQAGLWIDHRQAIIVFLRGGAEDLTSVLESGVEKQLRRLGDSPMKGPFETDHIPADDRRQRSYTEHLNDYYDKVILQLSDAEALLICGPGEARTELKSRLEADKSAGRIVSLTAADSMTEHQFQAKVRHFFSGESGMGTADAGSRNMKSER